MAVTVGASARLRASWWSPACALAAAWCSACAGHVADGPHEPGDSGVAGYRDTLDQREPSNPDASSHHGATIALGTVDEEAQLPYVPLAAGGDLHMHTYGQGGLHVALTVRCDGLGKEAFVDITVRSLGEYDRGTADADTDAGVADATAATDGADDDDDEHDYPGQVATVPTHRPSLLVCDDLRAPQVCLHRPIIVMLGGLAPSLQALDGLHVELRAAVTTAEGLSLSDTKHAYLRR